MTPRPGLSFTRTEYGGVILDIQRGEYWRLNPVGAEVFASLVVDSGADLVAAVLAQFDIDAETARRDVAELVDHLLDVGLVVA
ncbi:lasso peptide biosynthesis PqqD family chaperone [Nocardia suismassiliense]|uniref:lasso peptide biosynthesis PqqD family chaperone n=1 Tax=Nocardia suismassiliense TaxID=2077092 RepID=UPI000D1EB8B6|nr:lasso peptide biosynthesis PqqD family chaperone [Nocardia suismassiliense]